MKEYTERMSHEWQEWKWGKCCDLVHLENEIIVKKSDQYVADRKVEKLIPAYDFAKFVSVPSQQLLNRKAVG